MEVEIKGIIEKIKTEGVEEAEKKAKEIIGCAEAKAKTIIVTAEKERGNILNKAKEEAGRVQETGVSAVKQASRDVLLSLRENIVKLFDRVVKQEVKEQFTSNVLKSAIGDMVESFSKTGEAELEIVLSEKDKTAIQQFFSSKLKSKITKNVTLKTSPSVEAGFRIGEKGKNSYYDFSDDAIAESLKAFLNPKITKMLDPGK